MNKYLALIPALLIMQFATAQDYISNREDLSKHAGSVVMHLKDSEFHKAFSELQKYWPLPENEVAQLESQTMKQFNVVSDRFGKIIGADFVNDRTVKDYVVRKTYVIRFEKHMIRLLFTYYKNDKGWLLNGFKWDDQFEELFD